MCLRVRVRTSFRSLASLRTSVLSWLPKRLLASQVARRSSLDVDCAAARAREPGRRSGHACRRSHRLEDASRVVVRELFAVDDGAEGVEGHFYLVGLSAARARSVNRIDASMVVELACNDAAWRGPCAAQCCQLTSSTI